jgi:hypothetical protein
MVKLVCCRLWPLNDNAIQYDLQLSYIVPIRPGDDDRQRDAMLFHQQMAFASFFSPCPSGLDQQPPGRDQFPRATMPAPKNRSAPPSPRGILLIYNVRRRHSKEKARLRRNWPSGTKRRRRDPEVSDFSGLI